jgi:hypothetical protein
MSQNIVESGYLGEIVLDGRVLLNLMCSMSVHYIIQKPLITNKMHKEFFSPCNTLLHVSTLLGHLQGELFVVVKIRLHFIVELLTVYCLDHREFAPP